MYQTQYREEKDVVHNQRTNEEMTEDLAGILIAVRKNGRLRHFCFVKWMRMLLFSKIRSQISSPRVEFIRFDLQTVQIFCNLQIKKVW